MGEMRKGRGGVAKGVPGVRGARAEHGWVVRGSCGRRVRARWRRPGLVLALFLPPRLAPPPSPHSPVVTLFFFFPAVDLEWKLIFVGSAESERFDQVLDSVFVGPVVPGQYRFVFQTDPPDYAKVPADDIVGVTVLLLTCSYKGREFIRVGYYVNTDYADEALRDDPPERPQLDRLVRTILENKPRVTKFAIEWDDVPDAAGKGLERPELSTLPAALNDPEASMDVMDLH